MRSAVVLAALLCLPALARAQMPDLRTMNGKPLTVTDLAPGTVTVRIARQAPSNPVADVEVTATVGAETKTAKTGADGRATFDGLPPGASFQAKVTVDGEALESASFAIPPQGGTRLMLIAGLGAAAPEDPFQMGAVTGSVAPADGLPAGALEIAIADAAGSPVRNVEVKLGQVGPGEGAVNVHKATSDEQGVARFTALPTGDQVAYAAVILHEQMRLGTDAFRLGADKGARGQIRALGRTSDPSGLRIDPRSKIIVVSREEALEVMQNLVFMNTGDKLFDPGEKGLLIPLPDGHVSGTELQGGAPLDPRPGEGMLLKAPVAPNSAAMFATQVRFGYILKSEGESEVEVRQPMPFGMESPFLIVPDSAGLTVEAAGLKSLPEEKDEQGKVVRLYTLPQIAPGGTLAIRFRGLAQRDRSGQTVTAVLFLGLVLAGAVAARRPRDATKGKVSDVEKLVERREKLFAELVDVERARRDAGAPDPRLDERRRELVAKLEGLYRELARLEHGEANPA